MIAAIQHVPQEGLGILEEIFEEMGVSYRYVRVFEKTAGGVSPLDSLQLDGISGLVVLGGPMGVYEADQYPFLRKELEILKKTLTKKIPTLGICLGAQLLAEAGGGRVYPGPSKEIGWFPVKMLAEAESDPLLRHCPKETMAFHWHGDTFDLPPGAAHLASSERYPNQAFRVGNSAWGLQFHLEVTGAMIQDWMACDDQGILKETPRFLSGLQTLARKVFREFAALVKS